MNSKLFASSVAIAMLAAANAAEPAQAGSHGVHGGYSGIGRSMGGVGRAPNFSSVRQHSGPNHVFVHRFRHHRRFAVVGVYPYAYADGCYWLRRRALYTGSPYWWRRYYACRDGYY